MKFVKILLFVVALILLLVFVLSMMAPKEYNVSKTVEIDAPRSLVYSNVNNLASLDEWGPWKETDSLMTTEIVGQDGAVGAYSHWKGTEAGEGEQKLINLLEDELVETEIHFIEPFNSISYGYIKLSDAEGGKTNVEWGFKGEQNMMMRAMSMLPGMDMEANVGPMFEKGLSNLKGICEAKAAVAKEAEAGASSYGFTIVDRPAMQFVAKHEEVAMDQIGAFCEVNFPSLARAIAVSGKKIGGPACGIYMTWDEENGKTDMAVAFPVEGAVQIEGYETMVLPPNKFLKATYTGDYDQGMAVHEAIDKYMKAKGLSQVGAVVEEYIVGPTTGEMDATKWQTNIYYAVQ
jgi:effector-binding domain-containing protein